MAKRNHKEPHQETQVIIDGLEGDKARVELPDGTTADWDRASLPQDAKEGDVIKVEGSGEGQQVSVDHAGTTARRDQAQASLDALNNGKSSKEIDL